MKIEATTSQKRFSPICLSLHMKNLYEVQVIYALFNYAPTANWINLMLDPKTADSVRSCIEKTSQESLHTLNKQVHLLHHSVRDYLK